MNSSAIPSVDTLCMTPSFDLIKQLFDLPGSEPSKQGSTRGKVGRNKEESGQLGKAAMNDGDYEAAIEHFKRAVEQSDEKSPWPLMDLAAAYAASDNVPQAFRQYEKAKRIQKNGDLLVGLSSLYSQMGRQSDALDKLRAAVELEPDSAYNHHKLAEGLRRAGFKNAALDAAQVAIALAADQAFYHYWIGEFLLTLGRYKEAVDSLHAAIELSPGDDQQYFLVSQALWGAGRRPEAIRALRLATDIGTENLSYRGLLEKFLRESGLNEEADMELKKCSGMDAYDQTVVERACKRLKLA